MENKDYDPKIMEEVLKLSEENIENGGGPFAAAVVHRGEIIAMGANRVTASNDPTAHAEVMAIRKACEKLTTFELEDCEIYSSCEPCPMCLGAIYWARIPKLYYCNTHLDAKEIGFDDSFIYDELGKDPQQRRVIMKRMLEPRAIEAFRIWTTKANKTLY